MTRQFLAGLAAAVLLVTLCGAMISLPEPTGLTTEALRELPASGVQNPVTAVLLNYRGYDTLLEVGVLLLAITSAWSLRQAQWKEPRRYPLLMSLLRLLLPVLMLAGGYFLWVGAFAPGGAFQGGALLGGAFVLALLGGLAGRILERDTFLRVALVIGVLTFCAAAGATLFLTGGLLEYPRGSAGTWILLIEAAALVSIGATLGLLYLGGRPAKTEKKPSTEGSSYAC